MTHNRDELKEKLARAISREDGFQAGESSDFESWHWEESLPHAEACLSAIEQSGCTICPNEPTIDHYWKAAELHFKRAGTDLMPLDKASANFWKAMLSSSPFTEEKAE
jgi:hypothetical protein